MSFTFDDFPRSALMSGGEILREYGFYGTYYVSTALAGRASAVGEMFNFEDLRRVSAAGHELACHTLEHKLCSELSATDLVASCSENQRRIAHVVGEGPVVNFSFPEGVVTLSAKTALSSMYDTCRTIEPGVNRDPVDLGFLRAYRIYSTSGTSGIRDVILRNQDEGGWVILYTHDVTSRPSAYGCTPAEFRGVVRCAVNSGSEVLSIAEAVKRYRTVERNALRRG